MIKKLGVALGAFLLSAAAAQALPCSTYPNTLTNGTTADANQVMANFNSILNCANNNLTPSASPTFTGTVTLPDGSTWTSSGLVLQQGITATGQIILGGTFTSPTINTPTIVTPTISGTATEPDASTWSLVNGLTGLTKLYLGLTSDQGGGQSLQSSGSAFFAGGAVVTGVNSGSDGYGRFSSTTGNGAQVIGQGNTNDYVLFNKGGSQVCMVATGTTTLNCTGLQVGGISVGTAFTKQFTSSPLAVPVAGAAVTPQAHGFGAAPFDCDALLVNVTGDLGYTTGQRVKINLQGNIGATIYCDATNVYFTNGSTGLQINRADTGGVGTITGANWTVVLNAWK